MRVARHPSHLGDLKRRGIRSSHYSLRKSGKGRLHLTLCEYAESGTPSYYCMEKDQIGTHPFTYTGGEIAFSAHFALKKWCR